MKFLILISVVSFNLHAMNISSFTGKFFATCTAVIEMTYSVVSTYDQNSNSLIIKDSIDSENPRFLTVFPAINEGQKVEKIETSDAGCRKTVQKTIYFENKITWKKIEKDCLLPTNRDSSGEILTLMANGNLELESRTGFYSSRCSLKRIVK